MTHAVAQSSYRYRLFRFDDTICYSHNVAYSDPENNQAPKERTWQKSVSYFNFL
jgi:hypothetical protein